MNKRNLATIDLDTGELLNGTTAWIPKRDYFTDNHITMFQEALMKIAKSDLSSTEHKVFNYLLSKAGMGNIILISFKDAANELELKRPNFSRAINGLVNRNILIKGEQKIGRTPSLRINYGVAWKGKRKEHKILKMYDKEILPNNNKAKQPTLFDNVNQ